MKIFGEGKHLLVENKNKEGNILQRDVCLIETNKSALIAGNKING